MSEDFEKPRVSVPRPESFADGEDSETSGDFDTAALLLRVQEELDHQELDHQELAYPVADGRRDVVFEAERPSYDLLREQGGLEEFQKRAEWFEREAAACDDAETRARLYLVASEHHAIANDLERAAALAERACAESEDLASRQVRQLAYQRDDFDQVRQRLTRETETASTDEERGHAAFYLAEIERKRFDGTTQAVHYVDTGQRFLESDPRPSLFKLARQLGQSARSPTVKWPEGKELEPLRFATVVLSHMRGDRTRISKDDVQEPLVAFVEAQSALSRGKPLEAGKALAGLFLEPELGAAARWLAAALLATDGETRGDAVAALEELLDIAPSAALRRTLAARSLEAGKPEAARRALLEEESEDEAAFDDLERVSLGALLGAHEPELRSWLERLAERPETRAFAWSVSRALGGRPRFAFADSGTAQAQLELAAILETFELGQLAEALPALRGELPDTPLLGMLELELAHRDGKAGDVARLVRASLTDDTAEAHAAAAYACGLLLERAQLPEASLESYRGALGSRSFGEAALRAIQFQRHEELGPADLLRVSELVPTAPQRRALLIEVAATLLDDGDDPARRALGDRALDELLAESEPSPLARFLDERRLLRRGDGEGLSRRLVERLPEAKTPFHAAFARARLARLAGPGERAQAWMREAIDARPADHALAFEFERTNRPDPIETAKLREQLARSARTPWGKARLLLEAALHYELGDANADAARTARESDLLLGSELAKQCFTRNALLLDESFVVRERWVREAQTASDATRLALYLRLFDLERLSNNPEGAREWLEEAHELAPQRTDLLVELEQLMLRQRWLRDLQEVEAALVEQLQGKDRLPHALLLARRERAQKGWAAGQKALERAEIGEETPLYVLRQLQAHARRNADDTATLDLSLRLFDKSTSQSDRVVLLLRAAAAALRLDLRKKAEELAQKAQKLAPHQVLIENFLGTALLSDDPVKAAIARENVAKGSRVPKHQAEAWYDAATLWLDRVADLERGLAALARAVELDPTHSEAFTRLFKLLESRNDAEALSRLVAHRLRVTAEPEERTELLMLQSRLHRNLGRNAESREALETLLHERPEHLPALEKLARIAQEDDDLAAAERALRALARLSAAWDEQRDAYLALGKLYEERLSSLDRAEDCYQEVLKRQPEHAEARARLLPLYLRQDQVARAKAHFEQTLAAIPSEAEQRRAFLEFVDLARQHLKDTRYQSELVEQVLSLWPLDPDVLDTAVRHHQALARLDRIKQLEEVTLGEVSRKLSAGFLEPRYLQATAAIAAAKGEESKARLMLAMSAALSGQPARFPPLHGQAMQRTLDEKLAPAPMVSALRTLLMLTRGVLEHGFVATGHRPVVQRADSLIAKRVKTTASQAAVPAPTVCLDATFPHACWLNGAKDMQLIFGERLHEDASNEELDFLIWRNLKLAQARAGVFTRLDASQTKVAVVAFLSCFVDVNLAADWDTAEFNQVKARIRPLIPPDLDDDVPVLALEALHSLAKSGEHLALAARKWANRTALLATGNVNAALTALTRLTGETLASDPEERQRQLADNPETRDLVSAVLLPGMSEALG